MRVLNIHGVGDVRLDPVDPPRLGSADVVVKVKACGICGSDLTYIKIGGIHRKPGGVTPIGHEAAGEIIAVGDAVKGVAVGQRVVINPMMTSSNFGNGGPEGAFTDEFLVRDARVGDSLLRRIGIEYISVFGLPPVEFVNLAADLGCSYIGTGLVPMPYNPHGYRTWSLMDDRALRQEMVAAMRDRGVSISLGEGFLVRPNADVRDRAADLDVMCELGVKRISTLSIDPDLSRSFDQFATLAEMTDAVGVETTVEFGPRLAVADLPTALAAVRHVARPNCRLLIDTMHLVRSGSGAADIAALDPAVIGYVQLCDAPLVSKFSEYMEEAKYERMAPGTGELPLLDILAVLPSHLAVGLEVPQRSLAEAGLGPHDRLGRCVEAARSLLARATPGFS